MCIVILQTRFAYTGFLRSGLFDVIDVYIWDFHSNLSSARKITCMTLFLGLFFVYTSAGSASKVVVRLNTMVDLLTFLSYQDLEYHQNPGIFLTTRQCFTIGLRQSNYSIQY